jgi:integrase
MPLKLIPPRAGKTPYWSVRGTYLGVAVDRSAKSSEKKIALRFRAKLKADIERGVLAKSGEPTFLSAALSYIKSGGDARFLGRFDEATGEWSGLIGHFGEQALRTLDQQAIDAAAIELYPIATAATRNRQAYTPISAILKHAGFDSKVRRPKGWRGNARTTWLWPEQAFRLFKAADAVDAEFGLFLRVLAYTGMRLSDALWAPASGVRLVEAFLYLDTTKNGEPRGVHLPPVLVAALERHPRGLDRAGKMFRFTKSGRLYKMLADAKAAAGQDVAFATFHTLCHTWATWMRRYGGLDTDGLVDTGRWRDRAMAARYVHVDISEAARRADRLPVENEYATRGESVEQDANAKKISA